MAISRGNHVTRNNFSPLNEPIHLNGYFLPETGKIIVNHGHMNVECQAEMPNVVM